MHITYGPEGYQQLWDDGWTFDGNHNFSEAL
jgi:hypothetical protein